MRSFIATLFAAGALLFTLFTERPLYALSGSEWPLEIINESGEEITFLSLSQTGMERWSQNRARDAIASGSSAELEIERGSILGLCDIKVVIGGREIVWARMPILEIFSITVDENFEPHYERIKLGA